MKLLVAFVYFAIGFVGIKGQIPINGSTCPAPCNGNINVTNDKIIGLWFLQLNTPYFFDAGSKCIYVNVTEIKGSDVLHYEWSSIVSKTMEHRTNEGTLKYSQDGHVHVEFTNLHIPFEGQVILLNSEIRVEVNCQTCGSVSVGKEGSE